jgi:hypothetical protein
MKAIFINAVIGEITEIQIENDWREIAPKIGNGCKYFETPFRFENDDVIFCDEEALIHQRYKGFFMINQQTIAGNGLILGMDKIGVSVDAKSSLEDIKKQIFFGVEISIRP